MFRDLKKSLNSAEDLQMTLVMAPPGILPHTLNITSTMTAPGRRPRFSGHKLQEGFH